MAKKQFFIVTPEGVKTEIVEFKFHTGFALSQKQKSINSMHYEIKKKYSNKILEVSTKSQNEIGKKLSAFNLKIEICGHNYSIENVFQSSKVFEQGGPYTDLLIKLPKEAKSDKRLRESGKIVGFKFSNKVFPTEPKTLFYNWIYCKALEQNFDNIKEVIDYEIFTDIEFNHERSLNCQAYALAIFVYLFKNGLLKRALLSIDDYFNIVYDNENAEKLQQLNIFD